MISDVAALAPEAQQEWVQRRGDQLLRQVSDLQAENERLKEVVGGGGDLETEIEKRKKAERLLDDARRQLDEVQRRTSLQQASVPAEQMEKAKLEADQRADRAENELRRTRTELDDLRKVLGDGVDLQSEHDKRIEVERERDVALTRLDEAQRRLAMNSGAASREEELSNSVAVADGRVSSLEARCKADEAEIERLRIVVGEQQDIQSEIDRRLAVERDRDSLRSQLDEAKRRVALNADMEGRQDALLKARAAAEKRADDLAAKLGPALKEAERLRGVVGEQGEIESEIERRKWAEDRLRSAETRADELQRQLQQRERMLEAAQQSD